MRGRKKEQHHHYIPHPHGWTMQPIGYKLLKLRIHLESFVARLLAFGKVRLLVAALMVLLFIPTAYLYAFTRPTEINMSYSENTVCSDNFVALPGLHSSTSSEYAVTPDRPFKLAGVTLFARAVCVTPIQAPTPNSSPVANYSMQGIGALSKPITITNDALPEVSQSFNTEQRLAIYKPLSFELNTTDNVFDYALTANNNRVDCTPSSGAIDCDIASLELTQSTEYTVLLERLFNGQFVDAPYEAQISTVDALEPLKSSIASGKTVYEKPSELTVTFSKGLAKVEGVSVKSGGKTIGTEQVLSGRLVTIKLLEELPRQATINLIIDRAIAVDDSTTSNQYSLSFKTSGGPVVTATNLTSFGFPQGSNVTVTFDAPINASSTTSNQLSLTAGGKKLGASVTFSGSTATLNPSEQLPWCTGFSVTVPNGLVSSFGVGDGKGGTYYGKTPCYTTQTVGYSANGRAIIGYKFGTGSENIVFVGGTHGDEASSTNILNSWIDVLDEGIEDIPTNRSVYVVPGINPDGLAAGSRTNANNIDLNRNFPANNWKKDVIMPSGILNVGGGGSAPLSEPESAAIASYVLGLSPELVLTYHATGGLAISNESGDSTQLTNTYAAQTGYTGLRNSEIAGIFSHDITGAFEDWLHDAHGIPAILIELWSYGGNEIGSHTNAMWSMVQH